MIHILFIVESFILSDVVISPPSLFYLGRGAVLVWLRTCSVIKQLSLLGLCHVLNTSLSVLCECELLLLAFSIVAHDTRIIHAVFFFIFRIFKFFARTSKYTFSCQSFILVRVEKASEIAFKPSCDTDSQARTNDIILGLVALKRRDVIPQLSSGWETPGYMKNPT